MPPSLKAKKSLEASLALPADNSAPLPEEKVDPPLPNRTPGETPEQQLELSDQAAKSASQEQPTAQDPEDDVLELDEDLAEEIVPDAPPVRRSVSPSAPPAPSQRPPRVSSTAPPPPVRASLRASKVPSPPTRASAGPAPRAPSIRVPGPGASPLPPPVSSPPSLSAPPAVTSALPPPVRAGTPLAPSVSAVSPAGVLPKASQAPAPPVRPPRVSGSSLGPAPVEQAPLEPEGGAASAPRSVGHRAKAHAKKPTPASPSLSGPAYSRALAATRVTGPQLGDRVAIARKLCDLCEKQFKVETSRSRQGRLCYEIGRLYEGPLGELDAAHRFYQKAHALEPQFEPTLAGLVRVRARLGQWEGTLKPLEEQGELTAAPADKAALLFIKALIQEVRLERLSDARADFERAMRLCPEDASLIQAVERHARREQDYPALDVALTGLCQLAGKDVVLASAMVAERARVAEHFRKRSREAAELYQQAFALEPLGSAAALSLEHLLFQEKEFKAQAALLKQRAELMSDASSRAASLSSAAALLMEGRGELLPGAELLEQAWQATPDDLGLLRLLADVYERAGEYSGMVSALGRLEQRTSQHQETCELCVTIGETMQRRLGKREEAMAYFEKARKASPGHPVCVAALCEYFAEQGDWQRYVSVLSEEEAVSKSRGRRAWLHARIARTYEHRLAAPERAIEHYRAALGLMPDDQNVFRELVRLLESHRRYDEVVELHERAADDAPNVEVKFAHLFKIGQIFEDLLQAPDRALAVYRRILAERADHFGAFFALQRAAGRAGAHDALVEALLQEAAAHSTPEDKLALLHRAGEVTLEHLGKVTEAVELFGQVLAIDKHYAPTLASLSNLYERDGRHKELLKVLGLQLVALDSEREKAEQLLRMGRLCEDALGDDEKALALYSRAYELLPDDISSRAVRRTLGRLERNEELSTFLIESLKAMAPGPDRARLFTSLGQLYEMKLQKLQAALVAYEKALEDQPDLITALDGRIRVLEQRGDPVKTAEALEQRAASTSDPAVRLWAALRRGELMETFDRSGQHGLQIFEAVLSDNSQLPAALLALERLYGAKGNRAQSKRVLRLLAGACSEKSNRVAVLRQSLRWVEAELLEDEGGGDQRSVVPSDVASLLALAPSDRAALRSAEHAALLAGSADDLAAVDSRYVEILPEGALRSSYRTRLGEHLESRNPIQALEQHRPALSEDAENIAAARGISRIAEALEDPQLLVEGALVEAQVVRSKERTASLSVRAAELLQSLGDSDRAAVVLKRALAACPDSVEAGRALFELLTARGEYDELLAALTEAAGTCLKQDVAAEHWVAVAKLYADQKDDLPAALSALTRLEKSGKANLGALLELSELYLRDRQWVPAVEKLRKCLSLKPDTPTAVQLRLRLSEVLDEHLKKTTDATRELREVLAIDATHEGALRRLLSIQFKEGSQAALETAQQLAAASSGEARAEALTIQGKLLIKARSWVEGVQAFAGAVAIVGLEPADASEGLRSVLRAGKALNEGWSAYERGLSEYLVHSAPGEHQARVYLELAQVLARSDEQKAASLLFTGVDKNPSFLSLRSELVKNLKKSGRFKEALPELQALLRAEPLHYPYWQELVEVYDALGQNAESHLATGPLVLLGYGNELQQSAWHARQPKPALLAQGAFGPQALAATVTQPVALEALFFFEALGSTMAKLYPPNLEALGTSARNRVGPRGPHPVRTALDRVCHCLGMPEIDLYFSDSAEAMHVVFTDPVGIVVPVQFSGLPEPDQVFYLASLAANIARYATVVDALDIRELRLLLGAAERLVTPHAEVSGVDPHELSEVTRRLQKALPWLAKGRIEDAARRYAAAPIADLPGFVAALKASARRAAMLLADDVRPVVQLQKGQGGLIGISSEEAPAVIADLLPFWASTEAVAIRRGVGSLP